MALENLTSSEPAEEIGQVNLVIQGWRLIFFGSLDLLFRFASRQNERPAWPEGKRIKSQTPFAGSTYFLHEVKKYAKTPSLLEFEMKIYFPFR